MSKRILIVEDDPLISSDLEIIISDLGYDVEGICNDSDSTFKVLDRQKTDLVLLDVHLSGKLSGIDIANAINRSYHIPFVFITSYYDDDTLFSIRQTNPAGYIVKPYKDVDIKINLGMALSKQYLAGMQDETQDLSLFVRKKNEIIKVDYNSIDWIKGEDNYSIFHFHDESHTVSQTLKAIEGKLARYGFVRVHKSYLVNLSKIATISGTTLFIGTKPIPIGKAYRKSLFNKLTII